MFSDLSVLGKRFRQSPITFFVVAHDAGTVLLALSCTMRLFWGTNFHVTRNSLA